MKFTVITSMNEEYFNHCGKAMLESYTAYWKNIPICLYNEDFQYKSKTVINKGWNLGLAYNKFQDRWKSNQKVQTFAKKGFSIIDAMENIECDRLIWLDADTICTREINIQLLELISSNDILSTHFGVIHDWPSSANPNRQMFSCETGFFILNKRHPMFKEFKDTYKDIYTNDRTTNLRRFYDGEVYGETVRRLQNKGAKMLDLNPGNKHKTPIPRSLLEPYITHYKAGLKDSVDNNSLMKKHNIDEI